MDSSKKINLDKKLLKFCREQGISKLKTSEFEFELASFALTPKLPKPKELPEEKLNPSFTDEDMMFWSSAGLPEERETQ